MKLQSKHFHSIAKEFARKLYPMITEEMKTDLFDTSGAMIESFVLFNELYDLYADTVLPKLDYAHNHMSMQGRRSLQDDYGIDLDYTSDERMQALIEWHLQDIHVGELQEKQDAEYAASYGAHSCANCGNITTENVAECVDCKPDPAESFTEEVAESEGYDGTAEMQLSGDEDIDYLEYEHQMSIVMDCETLSDVLTDASRRWAELVFIYNEKVIYGHSEGDTHYYLLPLGDDVGGGMLQIRIADGRKHVRDSRRNLWKSTGTLQESIDRKRKMNELTKERV